MLIIYLAIQSNRSEFEVSFLFHRPIFVRGSQYARYFKKLNVTPSLPPAGIRAGGKTDRFS